MRYISLCLFLFLNLQMAFGQLRVRVVDGSTNESIPYANISIAGKEAQVSNAEGYFSVPESYRGANASIEVSYLGFQGISTTVDKIVSANNIVKLQPAIYEIDEVKVQRPEPNALMAEVRKALKENYKVTQDGVKNRVFIRNMDAFSPKAFDIEVTQSTGFSKKGLAQANADIAAMTNRIIKHSPKDYNDILMDEYQSNGERKVNVIKAVRFHDDRYSTSVDDLQKTFTDQMLKHLDTTKYYRIKSGWFSANDTVSLRKDFKSKKSKKRKEDQLTRLKGNLAAFVLENSPTNTKNFQFIHDYDIYKYEYDGAVFTPSGELVYVVKFSPRKRRALYSGKMYVSAADFGLSRIDYALVPGKKIEGLNLKLILGVKFAENVAKGTLIYDRLVGEPYFLRYASVESGQYIYIKRPVKFIELTDKDRDVVEFEFKIEGDTYSKSELLNLSREDLSAVGYADARENDFKYIDIKKYDPSLWKEYGAIEPEEEMKRLQIVD